MSDTLLTLLTPVDASLSSTEILKHASAMNNILPELAWRIRTFFLPDRDPGPMWALIGRVLLLGFIAAYGWWFHFATMAELGETHKFIHGINLPFHEAGM